MKFFVKRLHYIIKKMHLRTVIWLDNIHLYWDRHRQSGTLSKYLCLDHIWTNQMCLNVVWVSQHPCPECPSVQVSFFEHLLLAFSVKHKVIASGVFYSFRVLSLLTKKHDVTMASIPIIFYRIWPFLFLF